MKEEPTRYYSTTVKLISVEMFATLSKVSK